MENDRGFSLLEVIIAMMILGVAASIILQRTRGQLDYAARARQHFQDASALLSRAAALPAIDMTLARVDKQPDHFTVYASGEDGDGDGLAAYTIRNFPARGVDVPIEKGPAPWQVYSFDGKRNHSLTLLLPQSVTP